MNMIISNARSVHDNKSLMIIAGSVILFIVCVVAYFIYDNEKYGYDFEQAERSRILWIFADSARRNVDYPIMSDVRKTDTIYYCVYNPVPPHDTFIMVWEIKGLNRVDPHGVPIHKNVILDKVQLRGEILDKVTQIKYGSFFNQNLGVDLDDYSKISKMLEGKSYSGFLGTVNRIAFEGGEGQVLCMQDCGGRETLFLMYKANNSFYLIFINSVDPFDQNIIQILDLN